VTVYGVKSSVANVAVAVAASPAVNAGSLAISKVKTGTKLAIQGTRFGAEKEKLRVSLFSTNTSLIAEVSFCKSNLIIVSTSATDRFLIGAALNVQVQHDDHGASNVASLGSIVTPPAIPFVADGLRNSRLATSATEVSVLGSDFGTQTGQVQVLLGLSADSIDFVCDTITLASSGGDVSCQNLNLSEIALGTLLYARVVVQGLESNIASIATIVAAPTVLESSLQIDKSSQGNRIEVRGQSFGGNCGDLEVTFVPALTVTGIIACNDSMVLVHTASTASLSGDLSTRVTRARGVSNQNAAVKVGTMQTATTGAPSITLSSSAMSFMERELVIAGSNFGVVISALRVYFRVVAGNDVFADVIEASDTMIKVHIHGLSIVHMGTLQATVTRNGITSGTTSVATIAEILPEVTSVSPREAPVEGGSLITIVGKYFDYHELTCDWGSEVVTSVTSNKTLATCMTPRHAAGSSTLVLRSQRATQTILTGTTVAFYPTLLLADVKHNRVLRFNALTGNYTDDFVRERSGGLDDPQGIAFGPDHNFFVASSKTKNILQFDGSSGAFQREFCKVPSAPKGLTFHYGDLFVCGGLDGKVYRYNGRTGAFKGPSHVSAYLRYPWSLAFDKNTNQSYVADMLQHSLLRFEPPAEGLDEGFSVAMAAVPEAIATRWTNVSVRGIRSFDMTEDSIYVTSPELGFSGSQIRRSDAKQMLNIGSTSLENPSDIQEFNNDIYICGDNQVQKFNRFHGEQLGDTMHNNVFIIEEMACSFMVFHTSLDIAKGK